MQDETEEEGKEDGAGSGAGSGGGAVAGVSNGKGVGKGGSSTWGKDERVVGMKEWRVPPTCYICHPPLASVQFWEQPMAVVAGWPFQIPLGMLEYDHARIASDEVTPKRDTIAEHHRDRRGNFAAFLSVPPGEHAVSMQNRGLLRYPLWV
ncbi:hypothetical protein Esi_0093_0021 [Ectocarpus siliculosus]|uniref:Uncharacterized protein n=1 Tax=Ectocarpus siliculosus TaxID=2880 RepID=D8LU11_ECTSI|nr:hypothetical protein Esi_0093_0021 [Ectocarpus siliculosus]|eukprot:CBN75401.1 hypothetical protein Esi_0093_0021 [Ectocarpus siliculosus]